MTNIRWFRDTTTKNIIVMVDDIEIERFPFESFSETERLLKEDDSCLWNKLFELFSDDFSDYSLENAELI